MKNDIIYDSPISGTIVIKKISIMKLEIKGKEYGFCWGLGAFEIASEIFEVNADSFLYDSLFYTVTDDKVDYKNPIRVRQETVFSSIVNWCEDNEEKVQFTYKQFVNVYNNLSSEQHLQLVSEFKKSIYLGKLVEELLNEALAKITEPTPKEPVKKKQTRTSKQSLKIVSDGD